MSFFTRAELAGLGLAAHGADVLISRKTSLYGAEHIRIGNNVRIDDFCILSAGEGGIEIGSYVHMAAYSCAIGAGSIVLSDFANISSRVSIYSSSDDYSGLTMTNPTIPAAFKNVDARPVRIGRHVIVGSGSVILPGVDLGDGSAVGALSLVTESCAPFAMLMGIPARPGARARSDGFLELERRFHAEKAASSLD